MTASTRHGTGYDSPTRGRRQSRSVLLFDDRCSVCRRLASLVIGMDRQGALKTAPLQSLFGDAIRRAHSEYRNRDGALFVRPDGTILAYSDAILATLDQVGGVWRHIARALHRIPRRLRDRACTAFASNRNLPRSARSDGMSR